MVLLTVGTAAFLNPVGNCQSREYTEGRGKKLLAWGYTTRDWAHQGKAPLLLVSMMTVHQPTDHRVEQDDERGSQRGDEEKGLSAIGVLLGCVGASRADEIQHGQGRQSHGRI